MRRTLTPWFLALALWLPSAAGAQNGTIAPPIKHQFFDDNGDPCGTCKLYTYSAGTTTPLDTYSDVTLSTANENPIVLDAAGRATIYLSANSYKFILKTSADVTIWTQDNISATHASVTGVSNTDDLTFQVDTDDDGSNKFTFLDGTSVERASIDEDGDAQFDGNVTIGNATEADKSLFFDGNAQDFHLGLDDSADTLRIGRGTTLGTTPAISLNSSGVLTLDANLLFTDATYDIGASGATRPRDLYLSRNATIGGLLSDSGFGTHTFSAGGTGANAISVRNTTNGAANFAAVQVGNDLASGVGVLRAFASGFTTSGSTIADSVLLSGSTSAGLSLAATHASGDVRLYAGGGTTPTQTIDAELLIANKAVAESGTITPAQITGDQNNYAPTGGLTAAVWLLSSDAARTITGITAGAAGQRILLVNGGAQNIVLANESASSTEANRMACPGAANFTLNSGDSVYLWYDDANDRWRVLGF